MTIEVLFETSWEEFALNEKNVGSDKSEGNYVKKPGTAEALDY